MEIIKLKGRTTVDAGYFYCPYIPIMTLNPDNQNPSWQEMLEAIRHIFNAPSSGTVTRMTPTQVQQIMQARWPGNYTVVPWHDADNDTTYWRLVFADPHEEIIWHLMNSQ